ncbi:MAG: hypothetical protein EA377_06585, partial [Phycisphaerales bacterium]
GNLRPEDEEFSQVQNQLNDLVNQLSRINEGAPGQQSASALLSAQALRELATSRMLQAGDQEMRLQHHRSLLRQKVNGLRRHDTMARALESVEIRGQRQALQQQRQQVTQQAAAMRQTLEEMRKPAAERRALNEEDVERVVELRDEANEMLRRASELGPAEGYTSFQSAIDLRRQADALEYRISGRDIEIIYEIQPNVDLTETSLRQLERFISTVERAVEQVGAFDEMFEGLASSMVQRRQSLRDEIADGMAQLAERMGGDLTTLYDEARAELERAAGQAQQAAARARGAGTDHIRVTEARIQETLGRLAWFRASGLDDQARLLQRVIDAGDAMGQVTRYRDELEDLTRRRDQWTDVARGAVDASLQALGMLTGEVAQNATAMRRNLELLRDVLAGEEVDFDAVDDLPGDLPPIQDDDVAGPAGMNDFGGMDPNQELDSQILLAQLDEMTFDMVVQTIEAQGRGEMLDAETREQLRTEFDEAMNRVRDRVEAGEVNTPMLFQQAVMEEISQLMMQLQ